MRKIITSLLLGLSLVGFTQLQDFAFVANGGQFEFGVTEFQDRATIGVIDLSDNSYQELATIEVESVQQIEVDNGEIFVAAQDSIIRYSFDPNNLTLTRVDAVEFGMIRRFQVTEDYIVAGQFFDFGGRTEYVRIFDRTDLTEVIAFDSIRNQVRDIAIIGDQAYVAQNIPSSTAFVDSIAIIQTYDLEELEFVGSFFFEGVEGGDISLIEYAGELVVLTDANDQIHRLIPSGGVPLLRTSTDAPEFRRIESTENSFLTSDNVFVTTDDDSIATFSLDESFSVIVGSKIGASSTNTRVFGNDIYGLNTDFASFGEVILPSNDTVEVAISPEDISIGSFLVTGIFDNVSTSSTTNSYYADQMAFTSFTECQLFNRQGNNVASFESSSSFDYDNLISGAYILQGINEENELVRVHVIKN